MRVERTAAGMKVDLLLSLLSSRNEEGKLDPSGVVAPRILRRIADVLMGVPEPNLEEMRLAMSNPKPVDDPINTEVTRNKKERKHQAKKLRQQ